MKANPGLLLALAKAVLFYHQAREDERRSRGFRNNYARIYAPARGTSCLLVAATDLHFRPLP